MTQEEKGSKLSIKKCLRWKNERVGSKREKRDEEIERSRKREEER